MFKVLACLALIYKSETYSLSLGKEPCSIQQQSDNWCSEEALERSKKREQRLMENCIILVQRSLSKTF